MNYELKQLSINDGNDIYEMLQEIPKDENGFLNGGNGKTFEEYKDWLKKQNNMANGIGLEDWMVPSNTYWLYIDGIPIGMGKIRHYLTDKLKEEGGHTGYAIRPCYRGKGFGNLLLKALIVEAKNLAIEEMLLTIRNTNDLSIRVAISNGGEIEKVNDERHFIWIDCSCTF